VNASTRLISTNIFAAFVQVGITLMTFSGDGWTKNRRIKVIVPERDISTIVFSRE
jgi:hypothetical protein